MTERINLPFDKKNHEDYEKISKAIRNALDIMQKDSSVRTTCVALAKIAGCSRGALYQREWVRPELLRIKTLRNQRKSADPGIELSREGSLPPDSRALQDRLKNYQEDNCRLFDLCEALAESNRQKDEIIRQLQKQFLDAKVAKTIREVQDKVVSITPKRS